MAMNVYELACHTHPDVILLDFDLPNMDGHTTMQHLRGMGINVPVIFLVRAQTPCPMTMIQRSYKSPLGPKRSRSCLKRFSYETKKEKHFIPRRYKIQ